MRSFSGVPYFSTHVHYKDETTMTHAAKSSGPRGVHGTTPKISFLTGCSGFTLTELMIGVAIIGLLAAVGVPTIQSRKPNLHFRDASRNLLFDLNLAKMEALKRHSEVLVAFTPSGSSCEAIENMVHANNFPDDDRGSYVIFVDSDSDGVYDDDDTIISSTAIPRYVALCKRKNQDSYPFPDDSTLTFKGNGLPDTTSAITVGMINSVTLDANLHVNLTGNVTLDILPD